MRIENIKGITLIALIITIIIMLILMGSVLNLIIGKNGIIEKAKLAREEYKQVEDDETKNLDKLYASILIAGDSKITLDVQQLDEYINQKVEEKLNKSSRINTNLLWSGNASSGKITLKDSIYNYSYLVFVGVEEFGPNAIVPVNKNEMTKIFGGGSYASSYDSSMIQWGFYISSISEDGKELMLVRSGISNIGNNWIGDRPICKIMGIL